MAEQYRRLRNIGITVVLLFSLMFAVILAPASSASVSPGDAESGGSISWILVATSLVLLMIPGVAFFYGGMLRKQSMSATIVQSVIGSAIVSVIWFVVGYSLAFGCDGVIGDFSRMFFSGAVESATGGEVSELEFAVYQMEFAAVTACVVLGACAERLRFPAVCLFLSLWGVLVYAPMAHWVWGGGFEYIFGDWFHALDFAGGTAVHICAGITGVAVAFFLGPRKDAVRRARPHSIPLMFLGAGLLLFGWIGFNGGSGAHADGVAVRAVATTCIAWVASTVTWAVVQYVMSGKVNAMGLCAGIVAGLVAITPCAGYVSPAAAFVIGIGGAIVCFFAVRFFHSLARLDDALDVFAVHGCGGIFGALVLGFLADPAYVGAGYEGIMFGGTSLILGQIVTVAITLVYCFAVSYALIWLMSKFMRVGVTEDEESIGQDVAEHGEPAYYI